MDIGEKRLPELQILYADEWYVAIHKPPGLPVHRSRMTRNARRFAIQMLRERLDHQVKLVHRLDQGTSGVLLCGRTTEAARRMMRLFSTRSVEKRYLAVVRGHAPDEGLIHRPLTRDILANHQTARLLPAETRFRSIGRVELPYPVRPHPTARYSLLEVTPRTGRMHQIRRHLRGISHPVIGDRRHGDNHHNRLFKEALRCHRLLLCATRLAFAHPFTGEPVVIETAPDGGFAAICERFGWHHF